MNDRSRVAGQARKGAPNEDPVGEDVDTVLIARHAKDVVCAYELGFMRHGIVAVRALLQRNEDVDLLRIQLGGRGAVTVGTVRSAGCPEHVRVESTGCG